MDKKVTARLETVADLKRAYRAFLLEGFSDMDLICPNTPSRRGEQTQQVPVVWVVKAVGPFKDDADLDPLDDE